MDANLKQSLHAAGVGAHSSAGFLLFEPWTVHTQEGNPYRVFTPFWKACLSRPEPGKPYSAPERLRAPHAPPRSERPAGRRLLPTAPDWSRAIARRWEPGEVAAARRLGEFLGERIEDYHEHRDALAAWQQRGRTGIPLVDTDAACNPHNWQWVAGCGTDAAPYSRIFNPVTQAERFDPEETYITRREGRQRDLEPIVDLRQSRRHALELFESLT